MKFLRVRKQQLLFSPGHFPGVSGILGCMLALGLCLLPGSLRAEDVSVRSFYYAFNTSELDAGAVAALKAFARQGAKSHPFVLVQGFGCDRGGFQNSQAVAHNRGRHSVARMQGLKLFKDVRESRTIILYGAHRDAYRRMDIRLFSSAEKMQAERIRLNKLADLLNAPANRARQNELINNLPEKELIRNGFIKPKTAQESSFQWLWFLVIFLLIALLVLLYIIKKRKTENEHLITPDEAEALEILTATADVLAAEAQELNDKEQAADAVPDKEDQPSPASKPDVVKKTTTKKTTRTSAKSDSRMIKSVAPVKILDRSKQVMAKKQTKITPITIKGALDREFEEKTLKELAKSPIHALEGLSPRHARLMEEGFGIKTIEDMAKLKYFEIAKAIMVLAKYEK